MYAVVVALACWLFLVCYCHITSITRLAMSTSLILLGTDALGEDWPRMRQMFDLHCGSMVSHLCDGSDGCVLFHRIQLLPTTALPSEHYTLLFDSGSGVIGLRSEEHTSELQSLMRISYAV